MVYILYAYVGKYIAITQSPHADPLQESNGGFKVG